MTARGRAHPVPEPRPHGFTPPPAVPKFEGSMEGLSRKRAAPRWRERLPLAAAAAVGLAVASYLALVQLGVVAAAWDPLFGPASRGRVLRSALSRALPVPDAALGALGYAVELGLALAGGPDRTRAGSRMALAYGTVAGVLGAVAVFLAAWQAAVVRAGCTLCLASAAISVGIAAASWPELRGVGEALHRWRTVAHGHA